MGATPSETDRCSTPRTKTSAPPMMQARAISTCRLITRRRGTAGSTRRPGGSRRWRRSGPGPSPSWFTLALQVDAHVDHVERDQQHCGGRAANHQSVRRERHRDGERVGQPRSSARRLLSTTPSTSRMASVRRRRRISRTATPVTKRASVASMNGAPRMAPTPIASVSAALPPARSRRRDHRLRAAPCPPPRARSRPRPRRGSGYGRTTRSRW